MRHRRLQSIPPWLRALVATLACWKLLASVAAAQSCCVGEVCFPIDAATCAARGGTPSPTCNPYPCVGSAPTGACCTGDGCAVGTQYACLDFGGAYLGDGASCSPDPCADAGACCGGGCRLLTPLECAETGGNFVAVGTACVPSPCDTGACCFDSGPIPSCLAVSRGDCALSRGAFQGSGSSCTASICNPGACCAGDLTCAETTGASCRGLYHGDFTNCADIAQCARAACCTPGACSVATATTCARIGGTLAAESSCSPDPCTPGACCVAGSCQLATAAACGDLGGTVTTETSCAPDPCAAGACCVAGSCQIATAAACGALGGGFEGSGTVCSPDPCAGPTCALNRNDTDVSFPPLSPARSATWVYTLNCGIGDDRLSRLLDPAPAAGNDEGPAAGGTGGELVLYQFSCDCAVGDRVCVVKNPATLRVILQACP